MREETAGGARILTLSRPEKRNAISSDVCERLVDAIGRASEDPDVRAVVLAAEGDVFAAGGDLVELGTLLDLPEGADRVLAMGRRVGRAIEHAAVPVVGAVGGHVFGGGCEIILLLDAAVVERHVTLAFRHARMGLCPAWGGTARLLERVGALHATRLMVTSATIDAHEALAIGLVGTVCPTGEALAHGKRLVAEIALLERDAVAAQKRCLRQAREAARGDADEREASVFRRMWGGPAHRAAMARFSAGSRREE